MEMQPKVNKNEIFVKKVHKKLQKCYMDNKKQKIFAFPQK